MNAVCEAGQHENIIKNFHVTHESSHWEWVCRVEIYEYHNSYFGDIQRIPSCALKNKILQIYYMRWGETSDWLLFISHNSLHFTLKHEA